MSAHILIFDSGLGGTTVLDEIIKLLPQCQYSYALDNAAFPYGDKTEAFLIQRIVALMDKLIAAAQPDLIVIACNTASTQVLEQLRSHYDLPFVGVVPAIKPAAALSDKQCIGLLATNSTVNNKYINKLKLSFAVDCKLVNLPAQALVQLAEDKILYQRCDITEIKKILTPLWNQPGAGHIDTLILGCTHFPALRDEIAQLWPQRIQIIDSGTAIAERVKQLLSTADDDYSPTNSACLYTTSMQSLNALIPLMQRFLIMQHNVIDI